MNVNYYSCLGFDSCDSVLMHEFIKWLLFGISSRIEMKNFIIPTDFKDTIIIVTQEKIKIFSKASTGQFFNEVTAKINNVELFITSRKMEENDDAFQTLKIAKFIQWTCKEKIVGLPLNYEQRHKIILLEQWPILQATAIDCLRLGFFTSYHDIKDISSDLEKLYYTLDLNACSNLLNTKISYLETTMTDFYNYFQREDVNNRLKCSEDNWNDNQMLEFIRLDYANNQGISYSFLKDLPEPRILYGKNTNNSFDMGCSHEAWYKTIFDFKMPAFHMTYENFDPITGWRIGRTFMWYNFQETYLDYSDEKLGYDNIPTLIYPEAFYLFNWYFILVQYSRKVQFDLILKAISIDQAKKEVTKQLNDFISNTYNIKPNIFDFIILEKNIVLNIEEYAWQNKSSFEKENKIYVIRFEVKEIISVHSHLNIGSLLFCDSFWYCYSEIFNLTSDILPFKFIMTSTLHYKPDFYNFKQILLQTSKIQKTELEYKGIMLYKDQYNIPYWFPDSKELGFDHNQMCVYYSGRFNWYEDYFVFNDSSIGSWLLAFDNIETFQYKEELKYTVFIITISDTRCIPLSGIVKNELIIYMRGNTERMRGYSREVIDWLRGSTKIGTKIKQINERKLYEYEIIISTMNENEYENWNQISNSYNWTNITDVLDEMVEYEYLRFSNDKFVTFNEYKTIFGDIHEDIEAINSSGNSNNNNNKSKIMFVFGSDPKNIYNLMGILSDFTRKSGYISHSIIPKLSLFRFKECRTKEAFEEKILDFYIDEISKITSEKNNKTINIVYIYHPCNIIHFIYNITRKVSAFSIRFEILNISYNINYSWYKSSHNRDIINKDYYYEDIVNYIFIDEGILVQDKIDNYNKIVNFANGRSKKFTLRSFYLNSKEIKKIFETRCITTPLLNFYFNYYMNIQYAQITKTSYQSLFVSFKYRCCEENIVQLCKKYLNTPLKQYFENEECFPVREGIDYYKKNENDAEYETYWLSIVENEKGKTNEELWYDIFGYFETMNPTTQVKEVYRIEANYLNVEITRVKDISEVDRNEIGLYVLGKNWWNVDTVQRLEHVLKLWTKNFPTFRKYMTKEDITPEEREKLNLANMTQPVPEDWEYVGWGFYYKNEFKQKEHPNWEMFIDEYIEWSNIAIDEHNKGVQKEIDKLLV